MGDMQFFNGADFFNQGAKMKGKILLG